MNALGDSAKQRRKYTRNELKLQYLNKSASPCAIHSAVAITNDANIRNAKGFQVSSKLGVIAMYLKSAITWLGK